jgi:hypothetical protein
MLVYAHAPRSKWNPFKRKNHRPRKPPALDGNGLGRDRCSYYPPKPDGYEEYDMWSRLLN